MKISTNQKVVIISQVALASRDSFKEYSCFQKNFLDHMVTNPFNFWYHFLPNWEQSDFMYSLLETHYISLESISIFLKPKVIFFKKKKSMFIYMLMCLYAHIYTTIYCWCMCLPVCSILCVLSFASSLEANLGGMQNEYGPSEFSSLMYLDAQKAAVIYQRKYIGLNGEIFNKRKGGALYLIKRAQRDPGCG